MKNDENWILKYTALREHVEAHGLLGKARRWSNIY